MSRRNPKSKSHRTMTARLIRAMASDLKNMVSALDNIAESYIINEGDHSYDAAMVDFALHNITQFARQHWPHPRRVELLRGPNFKVLRSLPLKTKHLIIISDRRHCAKDDIRRLMYNPDDKRIIYVTDIHDTERTRGLDMHTTAWTIHCPISNTSNYHKITAEFRARFGTRQPEFNEAVCLLPRE